MRKPKRSALLFCAAVFAPALLVGAGLGAGLAATQNIIDAENFTEFVTALPTKVFDINGELVTEFSADEKRELIALERLPKHLLDALITREDRIFYEHRGFNVKAIARAAFGQILGRPLGGGSTLTQQIAGTLYTDRTEKSLARKLKELWWALQMERRYTKDEILELYLNKIYFGAGTYGVNAAAKHYFGHSAEQITPAEAALLVVQLANPAHYNPFDHTSLARERQKSVLDEMVQLGYLPRGEADESFDDFWLSFDFTRVNSSAYRLRDDKAPWFSEYVRRELGTMLYGGQDIYTGGFAVHTTVNLRHQTAAEETMAKYIEYANATHRKTVSANISDALDLYVPLSELLTLLHGIRGLDVFGERHRQRSVSAYAAEINPIVDALALMFGAESLKMDIANRAAAVAAEDGKRSMIEGTLVSIENDTGYITALVGGSKLDEQNQYIRAMQAKIQPGSTFKPLYYSAAIDSRAFTAATPIADTPVVFYNESGKPYIPENFMGRWQGSVELWFALATSMNVPSLRVLDGVGFDAAINRSVALLGIPSEEAPYRGFDRVYPLGLGTCSVRPVELARAYAVFANQGKTVTPFAIRTVLDRNGRVVLNHERDVRTAQREKGSAAQLVSPQTSFIITSILQHSVRIGTLANPTNFGQAFAYTGADGKKYTLPAAGKTGTTQNWADAWAAGFTPYLTAVVWFGFDQRGETLGLNLTGSTLSGKAWAEYMRRANEGYPMRSFEPPAEGLVRAEVCSVSGQLPTPACGNNRTTQYFLQGTQPTDFCTRHVSLETSRELLLPRLAAAHAQSGAKLGATDAAPLKLDLSFLTAPPAEPPVRSGTLPPKTAPRRAGEPAGGGAFSNPWLN